jgi:hypothetical protein
MKFDNEQTTIKIQMQKRIMAVLSAVLVALLYFTGFDRFLVELTGIPRWGFVIIFLSFFVIFYIYHLLVASAFISYNDEESKIVIRFYQLNLFKSDKMSYEIPKRDFTGFKINYKLNKFREELVIFRKYQGKVVKYPPVPISSLTKSERSKLIKSLDKFVTHTK